MSLAHEKTDLIVENWSAAGQRISTANDFHLSIGISLPWVSFALLDKSTQRYEFLQRIKLSRYVTPERIDQVSPQLFKDCVSYQGNISNVSCHVTNVLQTLLPHPLFEVGKEREILELSAEVPQQWTVLKDHVNSGAIINVYSIASELIQSIQAVFPTTKFVHGSTVAIESALIHQRNNPGKKVIACFEGNCIHIVVSEGKNIHFYNQYSCESEGDAAYYIMLAMEINGILPENRDLILLGSHASKAACIEQLQPYIDKLDLSYPGSFSCAPELPLHAGSDYFILLNQYLCA